MSRVGSAIMDGRDDDDQTMREVVAQWRAAGPGLAALRRQEVAALTDEEALAATLDLLAAVDELPSRPPRPTSGLIVQQRLFARARDA